MQKDAFKNYCFLIFIQIYFNYFENTKQTFNILICCYGPF